MSLDSFEEKINKFLRPFAEKLQQSDSMQAVSEGFVRTAPITLGICLLTIVGNFPVEAWISWLTAIGIKPFFDAVLNAGTGVLALYVSFTIAYAFAKRVGDEPLACGLLSVLSFLMLVPHTVVGPDEAIVPALSLSYLGGSGILASLCMSLIVAHLYHALSKRGLKLKMPASVPPMVSESLSPFLIATIIVCFAFGVRILFGFTPWGNFVDAFQSTVGQVIMSLGASPWAILAVYTLQAVIWFFGIHPATIGGLYDPVVLSMTMTSLSQFAAGEPMTYQYPLMVYGGIATMGGAGCGLGLAVSTLFAKSKRYKQMCKIALAPALFNINEPLIFGMPVLLNPTFFIPMVITPVVLILFSMAYLAIVPIAFNPAGFLLPWTTPPIVGGIVSGGIPYAMLGAINIVLATVCYLPFFKAADKRAIEEEREAEAQPVA